MELAKQVRSVHSKARLTIRNFRPSNSPNVLKRVGGQQTESPKKHDVFVFQGVFREELQLILQNDSIPTKREVFVVMSVFDPTRTSSCFCRPQKGAHAAYLALWAWMGGAYTTLNAMGAMDQVVAAAGLYRNPSMQFSWLLS